MTADRLPLAGREKPCGRRRLPTQRFIAPPTNAVVFSVDEKTAIQALDRFDPVLPMSPGRAERHGFEYKRNGTLSLYAALNVATGAVKGMTAARHTSAAFLQFLDRVIATQSPRREIHLIPDNLSAHKTKAVSAWLDAHPRVTLHFTPTYSSWQSSRALVRQD